MEYKVYFNDETTFKSHSLDSKWNEMPNKPIIKLEYYVGPKKLILRGFRAYNHIVVRVRYIQGKEVPLQAILMGKTNQTTYCIEFNLKNEKVKQYKCPCGQELNNKEVSGWKEGISGKPDVVIE